MTNEEALAKVRELYGPEAIAVYDSRWPLCYHVALALVDEHGHFHGSWIAGQGLTWEAAIEELGKQLKGVSKSENTEGNTEDKTGN